MSVLFCCWILLLRDLGWSKVVDDFSIPEGGTQRMLACFPPMGKQRYPLRSSMNDTLVTCIVGCQPKRTIWSGTRLDGLRWLLEVIDIFCFWHTRVNVNWPVVSSSAFYWWGHFGIHKLCELKLFSRLIKFVSLMFHSWFGPWLLKDEMQTWEFGLWSSQILKWDNRILQNRWTSPLVPTEVPMIALVEFLGEI